MFSLEYHCTAYHCPENQHLCNQKRWPCLAHDPCLSFGSIELGRLQSSHKVLCQNRWHQCVCQKRIIKYARLCQYSHSRGQPKTFQAFPDYENLTEVHWTEKICGGWGPLTPASTACAEGSDGKATSRPPEVSAEKAFAQLVVGIHATLQRQQTPGPRSRLSRLFSVFFKSASEAMKTARNSWHKECIERSNNSASIASISQQRATDVSMWEWGVLEVCSIHIYSLKHHIYIYYYYHPIVFTNEFQPNGFVQKKMDTPNMNFNSEHMVKWWSTLRFPSFFMVFSLMFFWCFFAWW